MANQALPKRELSLSEMLADPIVQAVMGRDGVTRQNVEDVIERALTPIRNRCLASSCLCTAAGVPPRKDDAGPDR